MTQARIDMSELDEDGDGFLQPQVQLLLLLTNDFCQTFFNFPVNFAKAPEPSSYECSASLNSFELQLP